jgi:sugar phosphate isomerase/epimerase
MAYTRREFGKVALAGIPSIGLLARQAKPNSKWAGVQVGMNAPYNFGSGAANNYMSGDEVLAKCLQLGISAVELRSQPVEASMGGPGRGSAADVLSTWRTSVPATAALAFRRKFEDAGVKIEILKFDGFTNFTDPVLDYAFELAKGVGARAISCELPVRQVEVARRLGQFADKHQIMIGFHGHTEMTPALWEQAFSYSKYNGANLDIGHFVGGNKTSPVPFLTQHHARITHLHVKDKTLQDADVPFGQGDTPIRECLQLIRDNKWDIQATIEFEYAVPPGSDRMAELAKCIEYCKAALLEPKK